jgi:hypothetical protein
MKSIPQTKEGEVARNTQYVKHTSYSPRQHVDLPPIKARSNKLRIGSTDDSGRCSTLKQTAKAYENAQSWYVVKFRDTGE